MFTFLVSGLEFEVLEPIFFGNHQDKKYPLKNYYKIEEMLLGMSQIFDMHEYFLKKKVSFQIVKSRHIPLKKVTKSKDPLTIKWTKLILVTALRLNKASGA